MKTFLATALVLATYCAAQAPYEPILCNAFSDCACPGQGDPVCARCPEDGGSRFVNQKVCYCENIAAGGFEGTGRECSPAKANGPAAAPVVAEPPYEPILCAAASECACEGQGDPVCARCPEDGGSRFVNRNVCYCENIPGGGFEGSGRECSPSKTNGPSAAEVVVVEDPCEGLNSRRPHLASISNAGWSLYERGVIALKNSGVYDRFVDIHFEHQRLAHGGANFLVWHRAFLWELEKELNAAVPGARIPWYDWSSVTNPLTHGVWGANRLGSANTNAVNSFQGDPIQNGPFQNFDSQLRRAGTSRVDIPDRQFIVDGLEAGLEFAAFSNWLEALHGAFHVAVGGSMRSPSGAPRDPVFFAHHAYVDRIYREWQNKATNANQFTGEHNGVPVTAQTEMVPFGRQAGGILEGISNCVSYVGGGTTVSRQVVFGEDIGVTEGTISGGDGDIVKKITKAVKKDLLVKVAEKKMQDPQKYKVEVKEAVDKVKVLKEAALTFGMSAEKVVAFEKTMAVIKLQKGIDIAEPEVIDESDAEVRAEGKVEVDAIAAGRDDLLKPSKTSEDASDTVTTSD